MVPTRRGGRPWTASWPTCGPRYTSGPQGRSSGGRKAPARRWWWPGWRPRHTCCAAVAGPTREERAIADAEVEAAASALAVLERRLNKTILRAPADGVVTVIVAEIGENIRAGQPVLVIAETGKQFLSFNAREDLLRGLTVGTSVDVRRSGAAEKTPALVTELRPLGTFATWQAERAVGDHDRNTLRLRLDLRGDPTGFEPGMSVWLDR